MSGVTQKYRGGSPKNKTRRNLKIKSTIEAVTEPTSMEPTVTEPTIIESIANLNPFQGSPDVVEPIVPDEKHCENNKCPVGQRCDKKTKMCYKLIDLTLVSGDRTRILTVDGKRGKVYDIPFLTKHIDRIYQLQNDNVNGKKMTVSRMGQLINDLKKRLRDSTINTYYGTLKDELIIQILVQIITIQ